MPFTLYHLGPGILLGLPLRKIIHAPTFILANIILDIEPLLVLILNLHYPLHGYLHTFLAAIPVGIALGYTMHILEKLLQPLYKLLLLETENTLNLKSFIIAGPLGTTLHILLDAPLYEDIKPFYPSTINPLYNPSLTLPIYDLCSWMLTLGLIYYIGLIIKTTYKKLRK